MAGTWLENKVWLMQWHNNTWRSVEIGLMCGCNTIR